MIPCPTEYYSQFEYGHWIARSSLDPHIICIVYTLYSPQRYRGLKSTAQNPVIHSDSYFVT